MTPIKLHQNLRYEPKSITINLKTHPTKKKVNI